MIKRFASVLLVLLLGVVGVVVHQPTLASAEGHPYTTPGIREHDGRQWRTTCDAYSSTVERCRAEIWASQARVVDGQYQLVTEFIFNNLTYLPSNGANWRDKDTGEINPLATDGQFTGTDGRLWKTECATEWTGHNGCRSFTFVTVVNATSGPGGWTFTPENRWVFNNVVQFVPGTRPVPGQQDDSIDSNPCDAPAPAGFTFTAEGRPHVIKPGYEPADHYNPISLANFIKVSLRSRTLDDADRLCFALLAANHLLDGGIERQYNGEKSLWFPYPFEFNANPSLPNLEPGWYSGLGQAGAMTAFMELASFTQDSSWLDVAEKIFASYLVPLEQGGFLNRSNGFLWFEEYPTTPPTAVYNGHFQNVLGLHTWARHSDDPRAWALFNEAIESLKGQVPKMLIPVPGGTMSSYDMVRGYSPTPLRAVAVTPSATARITSVALNGRPLQDTAGRDAILPIGAQVTESRNLLRNPKFSDSNGDGRPDQWSIINNNTDGIRLSGDWVGVRPRGNQWAGVEQFIDVDENLAGRTMSLAFNSRLEIAQDSDGVFLPGTGGKVPVYSVCPGPRGTTVTTLLHENANNRTKTPAWSTSSFTAPEAGCQLRIQLVTYSYGVTTTTAWYSNVTLRVADALSHHVLPKYDLEVHKTPTNVLTLKGEGTVEVQAYDGGRWLPVDRATLTAGGTDVVIPERFTGRNVNVNYHDGHVSELQRIACISGVRLFDDIAEELSHTSAGTAYDPGLFGDDSRNCVPEVTTLAHGEEVLLVAAEPEPMDVVPAAVPTSMELPGSDEQN